MLTLGVSFSRPHYIFERWLLITFIIIANKKKDRLMSAAGLGVATEDEIQEFNQNDSDGSESD